MKIMNILFLSMVMAMPITAVHAQDDVSESKNMKEQGFGRMRERMEKKVQEIYGQLNLTDDQKKQLEENKKNNTVKMEGSFASRKQLREQLKNELMNKDLDMAKINAIQTQLKDLQNQSVDGRLNSILSVRKILTPEQFSKFITLMEEQKKQHMGMMDKD